MSILEFDISANPYNNEIINALKDNNIDKHALSLFKNMRAIKIF